MYPDTQKPLRGFRPLCVEHCTRRARADGLLRDTRQSKSCDNWNSEPPRPQSMACRIVLSGASSVGKTTLATDWIERHGEYAHIGEVARNVMKQLSLTREHLITSLGTPDKATFLHLQRLIFEEQNRREISLENQPFISDRGPDPLAYVSLKKSPEAADELAKTAAASACLDRYRKSLVLVLCPLATQSDDGFRMVQDREEQCQFTRVLCEQLQKHRIPYVYVDETDRRKRLSVLERAVQGKLASEDAVLKPFCTVGYDV